MKKVMIGNHATAWAAMMARVQVVPAYPITPQTSIIEEIAEMTSDGRLDATFIRVESEHSAMAVAIGASAVGARTFTATSSQGLLLMHEMLHYAAGSRLPIVMANVNRAVAPPWNIWDDQTDSLSQRDTGWIQFYCESNQEVFDTTIMAFKLAEKTLTPVMLALDAFFLSHTSEAVDIPEQVDVDSFLPSFKAKYKLDTDNPHAFGALAPPNAYMEMRLKNHREMISAEDELEFIEKEFKKKFGRSYGAVEAINLEDADIVLITTGTITSTCRGFLKRYWEKGEKIGILKIKMFRPFPSDTIRRLLRRKKKAAVLDRNVSIGHEGIFCQEIKSALYALDDGERPKIFGYILGLGGRDVTEETLREIVENIKGEDFPAEDDIWVGVKDVKSAV